MTAWLAKVGDELDLLVREGPDLAPVHHDRADHLALAHQRHAEHRPDVLGLHDLDQVRVLHDRGLRDVLDVHGVPRPLGPEHRPADPVLPRAQELRELLPDAPPGRGVEALAVQAENGAELRVGERAGLVEDLVEDRREVGRRARDDAEDLRGGRLLLEGLAQIPVARLQLLEEAHVLDRDDRLRGERLEELDLLVGEGPHLVAAHHHGAERHALAHERRHQGRPVPVGPRVGRSHGVLRGLGRQIGDVDGAAVHHGPARHPLPVDRLGGHRRDRGHDRARLGHLGHDVARRRVDLAVVGDDAHEVALDPEDDGVDGVAEARRALGHRVQHRLDVRRRARDDGQDLRRRRLLLQRLAELGVARLQLLEEAHVLDRDDRLRGERLEQPDLPVRERPDLLAPNRDDADRRALPQEGHREVRAMPARALVDLPLGILRVRFGREVVDVDGAPVHDGPACHGAPG